METKTFDRETPTGEFLRENWEPILRRSASNVARHALRVRRCEQTLAFINRAAIAVGVFLIVQFPFAWLAFSRIERASAECLAAL